MEPFTRGASFTSVVRFLCARSALPILKRRILSQLVSTLIGADHALIQIGCLCGRYTRQMTHLVLIFEDVEVVAQLLRHLLLAKVVYNLVLALFVELFDNAPLVVEYAVSKRDSRSALCF